MAKIVVALGGNAIIRKNEKPNINTLLRNTKKALKSLFPLIKKNSVVLTHGSGPSIGYLLIQNEMAKSRIPMMPLDILDAETEGQIGYFIQQDLLNLFSRENRRRGVVTVLTQVLVDSEDLAFKNPEKFVGPFYTKTQARRLKKKFAIRKDSNRGYRRVVPSPKPIKIIEDKIVRSLLRRNVVIAAGGGGIPVVIRKNKFEGVEAVVDKDRASAVLGNSIKAQELIMITDVPYVYLNFNKKGQKKLEKVRLKDLKIFLREGHFAEGSMGPKIEAAIDFLENSRNAKRVWIGDIDGVGRRGTIVVR